MVDSFSNPGLAEAQTSRPKMPNGLGGILDALENACEGETVSLADVMHEIGDRSFSPVLLVVALILVSPLSGIPGLPTMGAMVIALTSVQALIGKRHLWLPGFLMRRRLRTPRFIRAIETLRKPSAWIDKHSHRRLRLLTVEPLIRVPFIVALCVACIIPPLEILPFVTSFAATGLTFLALGVMVRDGLILLLGYLVVGGSLATLALLLI